MTASGNSTPVSVANRVCNKCGQSKPETAEFFQPAARSKNGLHTICRACRLEAQRARYAAENSTSRAKALQSSAEYRKTPEWRAWYVAERENRLALKRKYRIQKAKADAHVKAWERVQRQEKAAVAAAARALAVQQKEDARLFFLGIGMWRCSACGLLHAVARFSKNSSSRYDLDKRCVFCHAQYSMRRRSAHPLVRLHYNVAAGIRTGLRKLGYAKESRTHEILGCDFAAFKLHIERQFTKGMTWELLGQAIHIDHIVPMATAKTEADVLALNHFTNLRPLWAADNISKGAERLHLL